MPIFTVVGASPSAQTAAPGVTLRLRIETAPDRPVHAMALRVQTRIEPRRRRYTKDEQARLYELFGDISQWERTLRAVTWTHSALVVPSFDGATEVDLHLACTYDLEVAAAKYLHAVRDGSVPLTLLFSGSIFSVVGGVCVVEPVAWDLEAPFLMPAGLWHQTMEQFFPGGGWLRLDRATLDRLQAYRGRQALVSWDDTIGRLLDACAAGECATA